MSLSGRKYFIIGDSESTDNSKRFYIDGSSGSVAINTLPDDNYDLTAKSNVLVGENLDVSGDAAISGNLTIATDTLYVDATNDRVGINKTPSVALDIAGDAAISGDLTVSTNATISGTLTNRYIHMYNSSTMQHAVVGYTNRMHLQSMGAIDFGVSATTLDGSQQDMRLTSNGLGIGTASPSSALDVSGDAAISGTITGDSFTDGTMTITGGAMTGASSITTTGNIQISEAGVLEFGYDDTGKESNAGKIAYEKFSTALEIIGSGTSSGTRKVRIWDMLGVDTVPSVALDVDGDAAISQHLTVNGGTFQYIWFVSSGKMILDGIGCYINNTDYADGTNQGATAYYTKEDDVTDTVDLTVTSSAYSASAGIDVDKQSTAIISGTSSTYTSYLVELSSSQNIRDLQRVIVYLDYSNSSNNTTYSENIQYVYLLDSDQNIVARVNHTLTSNSTTDISDTTIDFVNYLGPDNSTFSTTSMSPTSYSVDENNVDYTFEITNNSLYTGTNAEFNGAIQVSTSSLTFNGAGGSGTVTETVGLLFNTGRMMNLSYDGNDLAFIYGAGSTRNTALSTGNSGTTIGGELEIKASNGTSQTDLKIFNGDLYIQNDITDASGTGIPHIYFCEDSTYNYMMSIFYDGDGKSGNNNYIGFTNRSEYTIMSVTNGGKVGIGTASPSSALDVSGDAAISGELTVSSDLVADGGSKIVVQNGRNGGSGRGIYMWQSDVTNWGIYMAASSTHSDPGSSLAAGDPCAGYDFTEYAIRFRAKDDSTKGFIFENSSETLLLSIQADSGNTYIKGETTIDSTLDVNGSASISGKITSNGADFVLWNTTRGGTTYGGRALVHSNINSNDGTAANSYLWINYDEDYEYGTRIGSSNAHVGIGTSPNPSYALDVNGDATIIGTTLIDPGEDFDKDSASKSISNTFTDDSINNIPLIVGASTQMMDYDRIARFYDSGVGQSDTKTEDAYVSIHAQSNITSGGEIHLYSDRRIKNNIRDISDNEALETLRNIKPKIYNYIDVLSRTSSSVFGFIAQEVKQVLPDAVEIKSEYIPNVYQLGIVDQENSAIIHFEESVDLSLNIYNNSGARIKYIKQDYKSGYSNVIELIDDKTLQLETPLSAEDMYYDASMNVHKIFIYGQLVDDFNTLKKNAIWTITTAAVQEIDRTVETLKQENEELKSTLTSILERLSNLENISTS